MTDPVPNGTPHGFLERLPLLLSSKILIAFGLFLFFYLVLFAGIAALLGHPDAVSVQTQLILGNYTNVSSSVGASIAAGASVHAARSRQKTSKALAEVHRLTSELHTLMHEKGSAE